MFRRLFPLLLLFACSLWTAAHAAQAESAADTTGAPRAALTIVFSANSGGEYEPCPVCGGKALGGLARRATAFDVVRRSIGDAPSLFLAGPHEFQPYRGLETATPALAQALAKAYAALGFDAIFCMPAEQSWLQDSKADMPGALASVSNSVQVREFDAQGVRVGVVVFPKLLKGQDKPSASLVDSVVRKAKNLAGHTDVVVGVSPWGAAGEATFLAKAPAVFDVLLGSGPGPGLAGRFMEDGKTFWARAYTMGKAFHVVHMLELPKGDGEFKWVKDKNIRLGFIVLDKNVEDNPAMTSLLDEFELPTVK